MRSTFSRWNSRYCRWPCEKAPTFTLASRSIPIRLSDTGSATGDKTSCPVFSREMNPLSNRWSTVGVSNRPFSPSSRGSLLLSRQGCMWLAIRCSMRATRGNAAGMFNRAHVVPEEPLTATRLDECGPLGLRDRRIGIDGSLDSSLPFLDVPLRRRRVALDPADVLPDIGDPVGLRADQREQGRSEPPADLGQIDALQTIAVRGQRRVFARQIRPQSRDVILGAD